MTHLIWFLMGIFTFPTHLAQIIPYLKRKSPPPFPLYIVSLMTNLGIAFFVGLIEAPILQRTGEFLSYLLLGIFLYVMGVIFSYFDICWCCCKEFNDQDELVEELQAGFDNNEIFIDKIARNRSFPPNVYVIGQAYHYETRSRSYYDSDGNLVHETYQELVVSYENRFQLQYKSWQEEGNPIKLTEDSSIIHGYIYCVFKFDDDAVNIINQMRQMAYDDARTHDAYVNVYNSFVVPQMYSKICGTTRTSGKLPCVTKWVPTYGGRCLIGFLKLFGYSTLIYSCWTSTGIYMKMTLVKNISMKEKGKGGFRCGFMELDTDAIKTAFHSNNHNEIDQPDFDEGKLQETYNSIYNTDANNNHSNVVTGFDPHGGLNISGNNNGGYGHAIEPDKNAEFQRNVEISPYANDVQSPTPNYNDFQNMIEINPYLNNVDNNENKKIEERTKIVENRSDQSLSDSDGEKP